MSCLYLRLFKFEIIFNMHDIETIGILVKQYSVHEIKEKRTNIVKLMYELLHHDNVYKNIFSKEKLRFGFQ